MTEGEFREDLYYRINVIEIHVPALRQRGGYILLLGDRILSKLGGSEEALSEDARAALLNYAFPGNVRELENMLERALTLCTAGKITAEDLQLRSDELGAQAGSGATRLSEQIADVQKQAIIEALEKTRYNKTAAARLLGMSFRQLRYRIKKFDIK